ncbi:hypothetical protein ACTJKC_02600 [Pedobacter sp. 22226]|uniref:hypothetical protein n=1 Tax=Pedobacter sp. 22226 TaxID=3453894 RepID=UPI003F831E39
MISSAINRKVRNRAMVTDVRKVFYKSGFDHTSVTLKMGDKSITLQGRPYIYFYLNGREHISMTSAHSFLGNAYVYTDGISSKEKLRARWLHLKDQVHRLRVLAAIILSIILTGFLWPQRKLTNGQRISAKMGFWKMMGIVMGILLALAILFYIGLFLYIKFFPI